MEMGTCQGCPGRWSMMKFTQLMSNSLYRSNEIRNYRDREYPGTSRTTVWVQLSASTNCLTVHSWCNYLNDWIVTLQLCFRSDTHERKCRCKVDSTTHHYSPAMLRRIMARVCVFLFVLLYAVCLAMMRSQWTFRSTANTCYDVIVWQLLRHEYCVRVVGLCDMTGIVCALE